MLLQRVLQSGLKVELASFGLDPLLVNICKITHKIDTVEPLVEDFSHLGTTVPDRIPIMDTDGDVDWDAGVLPASHRPVRNQSAPQPEDGEVSSPETEPVFDEIHQVFADVCAAAGEDVESLLPEEDSDGSQPSSDDEPLPEASVEPAAATEALPPEPASSHLPVDPEPVTELYAVNDLIRLQELLKYKFDERWDCLRAPYPGSTVSDWPCQGN